MSVEDYAELDQVPIELLTPPDVKIPPPVVTRAQILPLKDLSWENLERLCVQLAQLEGDIEHCQLYGTRGQKQHGIDLFARPSSSEKYRAYQCKRYKKFTAANIKSGVAAFRKGKWFKRSSHFFLCTSASSVATKLADECEHQRVALREDGIDFDVLDCEKISKKLKTNARIVDDFFGRGWVKEFCGPNSLADEDRLDGGAVATFRQRMRRFYEVLVEQLDPGIPMP